MIIVDNFDGLKYYYNSDYYGDALTQQARENKTEN